MSGNATTILFWAVGGYKDLLNIEGVIGLALQLRGYRVHYVICDGRYRACARRHDLPDVPLSRWHEVCDDCKRTNSKILDVLGLAYSYIGDYIDQAIGKSLRDRAQRIDFGNYMSISYDGVSLGKNLASAMVRQTRGASFDAMEDILKEFAYTVLLVASASKNAIMKFKPAKVYMSHGVYADWGPALSMSLNMKIPVVSYVSCYLPAHFFFGCVTKPEQAFQSISDEAWQNCVGMELNDKQKQRLNNFLSKRYRKMVSSDMTGLLREFKGDSNYFYQKYSLQRDKPVWGIMTHINWDSVSDYFPMVYDSFDDWLLSTVQSIAGIDDVQWLIKIHPSEANDNPESGAQKLVETHFPMLPAHVKLIKMDDDISPLDFYNLIDGGVTVYGTGGLEISLLGKPVILAGNAHYAGKGFTHDASDHSHYVSLLSRAASFLPLNEQQISMATKYAYCYFIQKQIPLNPVLKDNWSIDFTQLSQLLPDKNQVVDFVCERIIDGKDFIMDESIIALTAGEVSL